MKIRFALLFLLLSSCYPLKVKKTDFEFEGARSTRATSNIDFSEVQQRVFSNHCTTCHPGYANYNLVIKDIDSIVESISNNQMPKNSPPLNEDLKNLITEWVRNGAPETISEDDGRTLPEPTKLASTWSSLSENVFFPKCISCHNPNGEASFLDLSSRQKFFENRHELLNNFEDPESSYLIEVISDPDEPMPPSYSNISPLSKEEIKAIIEWIELGLP